MKLSEGLKPETFMDTVSPTKSRKNQETKFEMQFPNKFHVVQFGTRSPGTQSTAGIEFRPAFASKSNAARMVSPAFVFAGKERVKELAVPEAAAAVCWTRVGPAVWAIIFGKKKNETRVIQLSRYARIRIILHT
jgi:hypothetical protein